MKTEDKIFEGRLGITVGQFRKSYPDLYEAIAMELEQGNGHASRSNRGTISGAHCDDAAAPAAPPPPREKTTEERLAEMTSLVADYNQLLAEVMEKQKTEGDININITTGQAAARTRLGILKSAFKALRNTRRGREE